MFFQKQKQDFWRDITTFGGAYFYFILTIMLYILGEAGVSLEIFIGFFAIYLTAIIIRLFYFKNRPKKEAYNNIAEKIDASSFPSVHSARAVFLALSISKIFEKPEMTALVILLAGLVCYSRIAIKKHYWTDVIGGIILGLAAFWLIKQNMPIIFWQ